MKNPNPKHLKESRIVCFDCDDTLVMWNEDKSFPENSKGTIELLDPYYIPGPYSFTYEQKYFLKPHKKHIQKLKGYARAGWFVIVWSRGGHEWAKTVVQALGLEAETSLIMSKPELCYDDLAVGEGIAKRKYYVDKKDKDEEKD